MCTHDFIYNIESQFKTINQLIEKVFKGLLKSGDVDEDLYLYTATQLFKGAEKGFGTKLIDLEKDTIEDTMLLSIRENTYVFSGFKSYQQIRQMSGELVDSKGTLRTFNEFKKIAKGINHDYNERFLKAEFNTAIRAGQASNQWIDIEAQKDVFPYLTYRTIGDGQVRVDHASLNGITRKVDDPFWSSNNPPNGWRCRCTVEQVRKGRETDLSKKKIPKLPPEFNNNVGKTGIIFPEKHPYFKVAKEDNKKAKNFFGLTIPKPPKKK